MKLKKIIAGGGLVLNEKNEMLLIFRRNYWDLPKGKLDDEEDIETCALREMKEETGIVNCELVSFLCKTHHEYFDKWINKNVIKETWWYVMKSNSDEILKPQTEEDIEKIIWADELTLKACLNKTYDSIKSVIETYKSSL